MKLEKFQELAQTIVEVEQLSPELANVTQDDLDDFDGVSDNDIPALLLTQLLMGTSIHEEQTKVRDLDREIDGLERSTASADGDN